MGESRQGGSAVLHAVFKGGCLRVLPLSSIATVLHYGLLVLPYIGGRGLMITPVQAHLEKTEFAPVHYRVALRRA